METMEVTDSKQAGFVVMRLVGTINAPQAPELQAKLMAQVDSGEHRMVIDFTELKYVSSAGLRVFLHVARSLHRAQGKLGMASLQEYVYDVFHLAGFAELFEFFPSVAEAITALQ